MLEPVGYKICCSGRHFSTDNYYRLLLLAKTSNLGLFTAGTVVLLVLFRCRLGHVSFPAPGGNPDSDRPPGVLPMQLVAMLLLHTVRTTRSYFEIWEVV